MVKDDNGEDGDKTNQNVNVRPIDLSTNLIDYSMTLQWYMTQHKTLSIHATVFDEISICISEHYYIRLCGTFSVRQIFHRDL